MQQCDKPWSQLNRFSHDGPKLLLLLLLCLGGSSPVLSRQVEPPVFLVPFFPPVTYPVQVCASPEPSLTSSQRAFFFEYIRVQESSDSERFTLSSVKMDDLNVILLIQLTLFNHLLDKLGTTTPEVTTAVLQSLPSFCENDEILRQGRVKKLGLAMCNWPLTVLTCKLQCMASEFTDVYLLFGDGSSWMPIVKCGLFRFLFLLRILRTVSLSEYWVYSVAVYVCCIWRCIDGILIFV